ncbi:MAG: hypothetical protein E7773_04630 [Sphingomonas sp.]|uniref:hypothetical protein n=1 Tax=Sphingomonas sp. TaxID=28214 RepID=UPI001212226C|nr:hypothetical protein [Sphingomonas sp.]THD37318.1 MAG: hypothetical protein E7773_04630 [Sphingomonas sp.]
MPTVPQPTDRPVGPSVLALRAELAAGMRPVATFSLGELSVDLAAGADAVWALIRRGGSGGLALRIAHCPGGCGAVRRKRRADDEELHLEVETVIGLQEVVLATDLNELTVLRATLTLTPSAPLLIPFLPRDVYPLGRGDDPATAKGKVEAAQRGLNVGISYFHLDEPDFGSVLYFQNLTAMNDYYRATNTRPDGAVGGEWPEIGYLPPTPPQSGTPPTDPLPAGKPVTVSDAILVFQKEGASDEQESALQFLQMLGAAYRQLDPVPTEYRDWAGRAERTLRDLETAPEATIRHYGQTYVHPYTASEYPDIMVQMMTIATLRDYAAWLQKPISFEAELSKGVGRFYDRKLGTMRRYLPNVGKDKDADAVDSWYLYHPLLNLGRLAIEGDKKARRFFTASLDYAIKAARNFNYAWPIQFKIDSFDVITEARNDDGLGQTDVGGLYAYVMLQAFELTKDGRYLDEACAAIEAAKDMRFELNYQANLTAWGAAACLRLWRVTDNPYFLQQSYVYLASFFHNTVIWESEIGRAANYRVFLGATCLHDAPYMAIYECFDSLAAFERYIKDSGPDLDPAVRLLLSEYCKYALDRAWFYYPDALPADALAAENRNGHIDRKLSFPVEDLYVGGDQAGQVGQEIYGAGAAFVFTSRAFHRVEGAPFRFFCDHFPVNSERTSERSLNFELNGGDDRQAALSVVRLPRHTLPKIVVATSAGERIAPRRVSDDRIDYTIPANGRVLLSW